MALAGRDFSEEWFKSRLEPVASVDFAHQAFQQASGQGRTLIRRVLFLRIGLETGLGGEEMADLDALIQDASR